ncbi:hypothetical protein OIU74_006316, partial [Salix koriyanagi]
MMNFHVLCVFKTFNEQMCFVCLKHSMNSASLSRNVVSKFVFS